MISTAEYLGVKSTRPDSKLERKIYQGLCGIVARWIYYVIPLR